MRDPHDEGGSPKTVFGVTVTLVLAIAGVFEAHSLMEGFLSFLRIVAPPLARRPIVLAIVVCVVVVALVVLYWIKRHYDNKSTGPYKAPTRPKSRQAPSQGAGRRRAGKRRNGRRNRH